MKKLLSLVLATAVFVGGCGKSDDSDESSSSGVSPRVAEGTEIVVIGKGPGDRALLKLLDDAEGLIKKHDVPPDVLQELEDGKAEFRDAIAKAGLDDFAIDWAMLTVRGVGTAVRLTPKRDKLCLPFLTIAIAGKNDLPSILSNLERLISEEEGKPFSFEPFTIKNGSEVKAWHVFPDDARRESGIDPCIASLEGRLILLSTSVQELEDQIRLYTDKSAPASSDFTTPLLGSSDQLRVAIADLGGLLKDCGAEREMRKDADNPMVAALCDALLHSRKLDVVASRGKTSIALTCGSEDEAQDLHGVIQMLLTMGKQYLATQVLPDLPSELEPYRDNIKALADTRVSVDGVRVRVDIPVDGTTMSIGGVLMGALYPAIASSMNAVNMNTMMINGRWLVNGVMRANLDRMAKGKPSIWPHVTEKDGLSYDDTDIAGKVFSTSTDYFKELFDIANQTNGDDWDPYVGGCESQWLAADKMPAAAPGTLTSANNAWIVVAGITEDMPDFMPVLISRNVDVSTFPTSGDFDSSMHTERIRLGGEYPTPFGNKGCVVVYKGGAARTFKPHECRLCDIFDNNSFTIPDGITLRYLKP